MVTGKGRKETGKQVSENTENSTRVGDDGSPSFQKKRNPKKMLKEESLTSDQIKLAAESLAFAIAKNQPSGRLISY